MKPLLACVFFVLPITAHAQPEAPPPPIALKLVPAAEPVPALRYRLLPELRDMSPGNAMTVYYRAFSPDWQGYRRDKDWAEQLDKALECPLNEMTKALPASVARGVLPREVDRAARRTYCDWELKDRIREEGIALLLPDVQCMREFAKLLMVRARLEMAEGQFDKAAYSLQTNFAMARHIGEGPTLIHGLVGIAIGSMTCKQLETWVQTPGSPNLYWSLTDLPVSFIAMRKGVQGERIFIDHLLPDIREQLYNPKATPMGAEQIRKVLRQLEAVSDGTGEKAPMLGIMLGAVKYPAAKKFLAERGWTAAQIEALPTLQAVFMHEAFEYDRFFDHMAKAANLPYWQGHDILQRADDELKRAVGAPSPLAAPILARLFLPAVNKVFGARARLDRQIAALRIIEAIRLHAAANDGALPLSLDAITVVPIPVNPYTGKPFDYRVESGKALLSTPPSIPNQPLTALQYELTIAK